MLEPGSASDSGSDGEVLGNVTGTRDQVDFWSDFAACGELVHSDKPFLNPARQKLEDWLSGNPWDILNLLPQWRRQKSEVDTHSSRTVGKCGGVTAGRTLGDS